MRSVSQASDLPEYEIILENDVTKIEIGVTDLDIIEGGTWLIRQYWFPLENERPEVICVGSDEIRAIIDYAARYGVRATLAS